MERSTHLPQTQSTPGLIADALRTDILQGKMPPGTSLRQDDIAQRYSVSKIPVREALVTLQGEGLVDMIPNRGAFVTTLSNEKVEEMYVMRLVLEPLALERAIPRMEPLDFIQAETVLKQIDLNPEPARWAELNREFHTTLYRPAGMPFLLKTIRILQTNVTRYLEGYRGDGDYLDDSQQQHWQLLTLCRQQNTAEALVLLTKHLSGAQRFLSQLSRPEAAGVATNK